MKAGPGGNSSSSWAPVEAQRHHASLRPALHLPHRSLSGQGFPGHPISHLGTEQMETELAGAGGRLVAGGQTTRHMEQSGESCQRPPGQAGFALSSQHPAEVPSTLPAAPTLLS